VLTSIKLPSPSYRVTFTSATPASPASWIPFAFASFQIKSPRQYVGIAPPSRSVIFESVIVTVSL